MKHYRSACRASRLLASHANPGGYNKFSLTVSSRVSTEKWPTSTPLTHLGAHPGRLYSQNNVSKPPSERKPLDHEEDDDGTSAADASARDNRHNSTQLAQVTPETHDSDTSSNTQFNFPNAGPNLPSGGGGFTKSPLLDAALTTFVGIGLCEWISIHYPISRCCAA